MKLFSCAITVIFFTSNLFAAPDGHEVLRAQLKYLETKDDSDLYVGESSAKLKDLGDWAKAEQAASAGARASLAEAIEVRVQSKVTDSMAGNANGVTETTEATAKIESDLKLANVKTKTLRDYPQEGTVTVLAYLSKKDYRRQLAGKAQALLIRENGVGLKVGTYLPNWAKALRIQTGTKEHGGVQVPVYSDIQPPLSVGGEVFWHGFILGLDWTNFGWEAELSGTASTIPLGTAPTTATGPHIDLWEFTLGYDVSPWHWAIQPYFPLRLNAAWLVYHEGTSQVAKQFSPLAGASAGFGLRFWANDSVALDVSGLYCQGLNNVALNKTGEAVTADMNGMRYQAGISFSGF